MFSADWFSVITGDTKKYDSVHFKKLAEDKAIVFTVRGKNDAHVGFFSEKKSCKINCTNEMYEIVIGGWDNSKSVIRRGSQGTSKVERVMHSLLNPNEDRPFWADAKNGLVRLGKGKVIGSNIIIKWQDNQPLDPSYVGFMTGWGSTGVWKFQEDIEGKKEHTYIYFFRMKDLELSQPLMTISYISFVQFILQDFFSDKNPI